jgi:ADP-ribosylglycohydrolase
MLGAIAGDIIGSVYEFSPIKTMDFELFSARSTFTDDTVLTVALADAILRGQDYGRSMKEYYCRYPYAGYGTYFHDWARSEDNRPYNSWGNGAAMRISPVGFAYDTLKDVLEQAEYFTAITHNHPEGIKGAQATAAAVFLARKGGSKEEIKAHIESMFGYDLSRSLDEIRPSYTFDVSCQGTVPQAITAFLESGSFEDAIRKAVSLGGDSDTLACITGGIAHAFYGPLPVHITGRVYRILDDGLGKVTREFMNAFVEANSN